MKKNRLLLLCFVNIVLFSIVVFLASSAYASTFTVDNLEDVDDGESYTAGDGTNTLRKCIRLANATIGSDTINFSASGTILPASALPAITDDGTIIDASSCWSGVWPDGQPGLTLDGSNTENVHGIELQDARNCHVRGFFITGFRGGLTAGVMIYGGQLNTIGGIGIGYRNIISGNDGNGVEIAGSGANNNKVSGNYIGTDFTGTIDRGNKENGIRIHEGTQGNIIGGESADERNIISGNDNGGIVIVGTDTNDNRISGNYIGTDVSGTSALGNAGAGVAINSTQNTVGGSIAGERNIISGNNGLGVELSGADNIVSGNYIGTDISGNAALGNSGNGIYLYSGSSIVGGKTPADRNVISGNGGSGVTIENGNHIVSGNYIGTNADGVVALGNQYNGVFIWRGWPENINTIGGSTPGERNIISGNGLHGVGVQTDGRSKISGNYIGTDVTGKIALSNKGSGVNLWWTSSNTIGGATPEERNVISGNGEHGVEAAVASGNVISGNYIGTDADGSAALKNGKDGIFINGGEFNIIGGEIVGRRNIISGNDSNGVEISQSLGNKVLGNYIGTDVSGTAILGNSGDGIHISDKAQSNIIGGTTPGERNVISGNEDGVSIDGLGTDSNEVSGNYIGTDVNGTNALGNGVYGVVIENGAQSNIIGGGSPEKGNVISGHNVGLSIKGLGTDSNKVSGNYIGTDANGTAALGNITGIGIWLGQSNIVGGTNPSEGNVISGNSMDGVVITSDGMGTGSSDNKVSGNYIGTDVNGANALGNGGTGVVIGNGARSNIIGGMTPGERNIISGNTVNGVGIGDSETKNNKVLGNYIGTDVYGVAKLANLANGIQINGSAQSNTIGGAMAGERNIISGNGASGVRISDTTENSVLGNYIGTDVTGTVDLGNSLDGVYIDQGAQSSIIYGNRIGFNGQNGVRVKDAGTDYNKITRNSIHDNTDIGIELQDGGNDEIAAPDIASGDLCENVLEVSGINAGSGAIVEIFAADSVESGEGDISWERHC